MMSTFQKFSIYFAQIHNQNHYLCQVQPYKMHILSNDLKVAITSCSKGLIKELCLQA